jgi:hypothetical protein
MGTKCEFRSCIELPTTAIVSLPNSHIPTKGSLMLLCAFVESPVINKNYRCRLDVVVLMDLAINPSSIGGSIYQYEEIYLAKT